MEVIVALGILGSVLIVLGMFAARFAQATSSSRVSVTEGQLASDRIEQVKGAPRYAAIESMYVKTEATIPNYPGYQRQTWVQHVGGAPTDTIDYKTVTVQVWNPQLKGNVRQTTVIAPF